MAQTIIWGLIAWQLLGFILVIIHPDNKADGLEIYNPYFIYHHYKVGWSSAVALSIILSALCPIAAFCYWIYKFIERK